MPDKQGQELTEREYVSQLMDEFGLTEHDTVGDLIEALEEDVAAGEAEEEAWQTFEEYRAELKMQLIVAGGHDGA